VEAILMIGLTMIGLGGLLTTFLALRTILPSGNMHAAVWMVLASIF
jgi:hypothetical protein